MRFGSRADKEIGLGFQVSSLGLKKEAQNS